jgi:hypothetical protein
MTMKLVIRERDLAAAVVATSLFTITLAAEAGVAGTPGGEPVAPPVPTGPSPEGGGGFTSNLEEIWALPVLVNDPDAGFLNKFALTGRYHGQYYDLDSDRGDDSDWENRRL